MVKAKIPSHARLVLIFSYPILLISSQSRPTLLAIKTFLESPKIKSLIPFSIFEKLKFLTLSSSLISLYLTIGPAIS